MSAIHMAITICPKEGRFQFQKDRVRHTRHVEELILSGRFGLFTKIVDHESRGC